MCRKACRRDGRGVHHELRGQQVLSGIARMRIRLARRTRTIRRRWWSPPAIPLRIRATFRCTFRRNMFGHGRAVARRADGMDRTWATLLDNMIAQHRLPVMIGVFLGNGGAMRRAANGAWNTTRCRASTRSLSRRSAAAGGGRIQRETGPGTPTDARPWARARRFRAMIMAWYHPEWYHRVLTYSGPCESAVAERSHVRTARGSCMST